MRIEYIGNMEFDYTGTIRDYDYTRRAVSNFNRISSSRQFEDMDSETIFRYLQNQMEIVPFGAYLKRYIYDRVKITLPFAEVPDSCYIRSINESFKANRAPRSFAETKSKWTSIVRSWLVKDSVKRGTVFLLGFGLGMSDKDVSDFLTRVLKEQDFRFSDPIEVIYWYCFHNGLTYDSAKELIDYYNAAPSCRGNGQGNGIRFAGGPEEALDTEKKLKDYLISIKDKKGNIVNQTYEEYMKLYRRACRAAEHIKSGFEDCKKGRPCGPADIESVLCSGIPLTNTGNLTPAAKSVLAKSFQKKRMSRQRINRVLKQKMEPDRFDIITLLFLIYASEVEPDWPTERYMKFIDEANAILHSCNMMNIYPVNPYESFVLMCLLTEEPLSVYSDVWEMSFNPQIML